MATTELLAPIALFATLLTLEVVYWVILALPRRRMERWLTAISPLTFYLVPVVYLVRLVLLLAYVAITGLPVFDGLTANLGVGLAVGAALAIAEALGLVRRRSRWPRGRDERIDLGLFFLYTFFVVALIEEAIFRGALMLAIGDGWMALLGSSAAMAVWHIPYYATALKPPQLWRSVALVIGVSIVFGVAVISTGSLWASIIPHGAGDFLGWFGRHRDTRR